MARTPDPRLQAVCRDRIRSQEASGLTVARFCDQESVARSKFHAWKRRFRLMETPAHRSEQAKSPASASACLSRFASWEPLPAQPPAARGQEAPQRI